MSSIQQLIADNCLATARQMKEGAGYHYDWGSFYDGVAPIEPDECPAFCYIDPDDNFDIQASPVHDHEMDVEFKGTTFCAEPQDQYPTARRMIADLIRNRMADPNCSGLAINVTLHRASIHARYPADDRVTVVIPATIKFRTQMTDPNKAQ